MEIGAAGYEVATLGQRGYNGVAIVSRVGLDGVHTGFEGDPVPEQSRVVAARAGDLQVVCVYVVNGKVVGDPAYETKLAWLDALRSWVGDTYDHRSPLIITGDFNIAPDDRDVWDPALWAGQNLASEPERERLRGFFDWGLTDLGRTHAGDVTGPFSYWDYKAGAFHKGWGLRIDLMLGTAPVLGRLQDVMVERDERKPTFGEGKPSDHAPVIVTLS
jgi:exodeoxyribonuclease-3